MTTRTETYACGRRDIRRGLPVALLATALLWTAVVSGGQAAASKEGGPPLLPASDAAEVRLWGTVRQVSAGTQMAIMLPDNILLPVRLLGVDVPEPPRNGPPASPGQPFGIEAAAYVRALLLEKQVRLDVYGKDRTGRALAVVWLGDINVNLTLIKEGLAWIDPALTNPYVRAAFDVVEKQAQVGKYGLWALPNPETPWEYRKRLQLPSE
jgi:endonuclease YncB( thermonuclease family)